MQPQYQHLCHCHATKGSNPAHWNNFMSHGFFVCSKQIIDLKLETQIAGVNQLSRLSPARYLLKKREERKVMNTKSYFTFSRKIVILFVFYCYYLE